MNSSTITPRIKNNDEVVFNLKPILTRIQQAVLSFKPNSGAYTVDRNTRKLSTDLQITHQTDTSQAPPNSVEITIRVEIAARSGPDGGPPPHPPKITIQPPVT
jgi:hypothetical protein